MITLTDEGKELVKKKDAERKAIGSQLVMGKNPNLYLKGPVCYDVAIFVRFLLGTKIKTSSFKGASPTGFQKVLGITPAAKQWDGKTAIRAGTAVVFFRERDKKFFHAGISSGGSKIRAVNGHKLGMGWEEVDMKKVLHEPDANGAFTYDKTPIRVFLSPL